MAEAIDWGAITTLIAALGGIWIGGRNNRETNIQADLRAKRHSHYLEWANFATAQAERYVEGWQEGRLEEYRVERIKRLNEINTEVNLLASAPVADAWGDVFDALTSRRLSDLIDEKTPVEGADGIRKAFVEGLAPERKRLLSAMRRDLGNTLD